MKSPGGSEYPYYYKGGMLHGLKYGCFEKDQEALFTIMKAEEDFVIQKHATLNIWVDLYDTLQNRTILQALVEHLLRLRDSIHKLAVVGLSPHAERLFLRLAKKSGLAKVLPLKTYSDPEEAKTWLVSE